MNSATRAVSWGVNVMPASSAWQRLLVSLVACTSLLVLGGCSPDDAAAAKAAAAALKNRVNVALSIYADLIVRGNFETPVSQEEITKGIVTQAMHDAAAQPAWKPDRARLREQLTQSDPRDKARATFKKNTKEISEILDAIDASAIDYEAAWPLGSEQFVCLKQGVFRLASNLRKVAGSFDQDASSSRYVKYEFDGLAAQTNYGNAIKKADGVAAATALQSFRELMRTEEKANQDVQAAFVQAAQSAADLYTAIESVEKVGLADVLQIVQRYAPGLSRLDESIDGAAIAQKAGVALGKVEKSDWLKRFSENNIPSATVKCKEKN